MWLLGMALLLAGAAHAQPDTLGAVNNLTSILARSMDQQTPAYLRLANGPCWEARIEVVEGDLTFGGGNGPAPRIFADENGPMLLLNGKSEQVGGASYMVLRASEATSDPTGTVLKAVSLCKETDSNRQCTGNIGSLSQFSLEVSSEDFCN